MPNPYGPWATLIDAGSNPQLSAFWRRRLTMLVPASQTSPVLSRHHRVWLVMAGAILLALPTFHLAPAAAEDEKSAAKQPATTTKKPSDTGAGSMPWMTDNPYQNLPVYTPLANKNVRKTLRLSSRQEEQLREIAAEFGSLLDVFYKSQSVPQGPATEQEAEFRRKAKTFPRRIEQVLSAEQLATLNDIQVQIAVAHVVRFPASGEMFGLDLNERQKEEFAQLAIKMDASQRQTQADIREKMMTVLSPQQRKQFLSEVACISVGPALSSGPDERVVFAAYPDLMKDDIRRRLDLSPQQRAELQAITAKYSEMASKELPKYTQRILGMEARMSAGKGNEEQAEESKMIEMGKQMRAEIDAVLTPQQLSEFNNLAFEDRLVISLGIPLIQEKIDVNDQQQKEIRRLCAESFNQKMMRSSQSMCETGEKALQILNPQQHKKLVDNVLHGIASFDGSMLTMSGGRTTGIYMTSSTAATSDAKPTTTLETPDASSLVNSVTVFPIVLNSGAPMAGVSADMSKKMAEVVGLLLERGGMEEIEIADARFVPPEKADLAAAAEAFGRFVQSQDLKTEYSLLGQFFGTPGKGVDEIRLAVVDRHGKILLTKQINKQQLMLKCSLSGEKKVGPMLACSYLVDPLREFWGLADPNEKDASEGKMAKLWEKKSGTPPESERKAMEARLETLKKTIQTSTVAVYPARVAKEGNQVAVRLAAMLTKAGLGRAEPVEADPKLDIQPSTNQTRIAWDIAHGFQAFLQKNPPEADYALLVEYGIGRTTDGKPAIGGIEYVLCDRAGNWVWVGLMNSHHADFRRLDPQTPDDCNRLIVERFESHLK